MRELVHRRQAQFVAGHFVIRQHLASDVHEDKWIAPDAGFASNLAGKFQARYSAPERQRTFRQPR